MFSQTLRQEIIEKAGNCKNEKMSDEDLLLTLLHETLPVSDLGSVSEDVLQSYVHHALFLRENSPYSRNLPEDIFLHFVFYPRINTERLVDCRGFFYSLLKERIEGLSEEDAVLEINRFACEHMTYQSSDDRTEDPLTAYRSASGRCGEESTFVVSLLRSVGIAARQVYVPWWVHCDDNHAWVEVYVQGKWQYLGACEPEPVLNRGWFTDAASRAPLVIYRTFFDYIGGDPYIGSYGCARLYNVTANYAPTRKLTVHLEDEAGKAIAGTMLRAQVLNMASFATLFEGRTDEKGDFSAEMGKVMLHLEAAEGDRTAIKAVDLAGADEPLSVQMILKRAGASDEEFTQEIAFMPPGVEKGKGSSVTAEASEENARIIAECSRLRKARIASWWREKYDRADAPWQEILKKAGQNAEEIYSFYDSVEEKLRPLALALLQMLAEKDYKDISCRLLQSFFEPMREAYADKAGDMDIVAEDTTACGPQDTKLSAELAKALYSPRIEWEFLEEWRDALRNNWSEEEKDAFIRNPQSFWNYLALNYPDPPQDRSYPLLPITPMAALRMRCCDERGRRLLFVAGMRTLGLPARLDEITGEAFLGEKSWNCVEKADSIKGSSLLLENMGEERMDSQQNFTLARWDSKAAEYKLLKVESIHEGETQRICAAKGRYRLITAKRLPNGKQLARISYFTVKEEPEKRILLKLARAGAREMLSNYAIEEFCLQAEDGKRSHSDDLLKDKNLLIYLEVSKEPTEHILNELIENAKEINEQIARGMQLFFALRKEEELQDPTLQNCLKEIPGIRIFYDDFKQQAFTLARKMFLEPGVWPLAVLMNKKRQGLYGVCGYQVGTIKLVLQILEAVIAENDDISKKH